MSRKYAIEFDGQFANCDSLKVNDMTIEQIRAEEREKTIDDYTEWLRKNHANFDEDYAEDIKSDYLEQLKEKNETEG